MRINRKGKERRSRKLIRREVRFMLERRKEKNRVRMIWSFI